MGCFLACFGSSKDEKRRRARHKVQVQSPPDQKHANYQSVVTIVPPKEESTEKPISIAPEIREKPEEKLSSSSRKKVTFDNNVKTYEHVVPDEITDAIPGNIEDGKKEEEENSIRQSQSHSTSEDSSITGSSTSYPPNHRYQNCRDSDDEEGLDLEESDIEEDDDDLTDYDDEGQDSNDICEDHYNGAVETTILVSPTQAMQKEVNSPIESNQSARYRSGYVHPVLNPVENLSQWRALKKKKGTQHLRRSKENLELDQESRVSFSLEQSFKETSFSSMSKPDQPKKLTQEIPLDASLSNWLVSPQTTPKSKVSTTDPVSNPEMSMSKGSNSITSLDDRPILGALTMEELKQISASSSPRKSPKRSPDETPIIGTVGTYWSHTSSVEDHGSACSFKGIPNTTSKYREDKRVNWHSTPFETRVERALNARGAGGAV